MNNEMTMFDLFTVLISAYVVGRSVCGGWMFIVRGLFPTIPEEAPRKPGDPYYSSAAGYEVDERGHLLP
jgi:hypothetical protein